MFYSQVPTIFWWDNFDKNVDRSVGGGSIHITPGIAFQEIVSEAEYQKETVAIPRSKRCSIILPSDPYPSLAIKINPKNNPAKFTTSLEPVYSEASESFMLYGNFRDMALRIRNSIENSVVL